MILKKEFVSAANNIKQTPFLLTDLKQVTKNFTKIKQLFPDIHIYYAIKSNNYPDLIQHLTSIGSGFDTASINEIKLALKTGVSPNKISFSAPIKKSSEIQIAHKKGVCMYTFDSPEELQKIFKHAPKSKVTIRVHVDSSDSQCPMYKKFGTSIEESTHLLLMAKGLDLDACGITFHVGSQCLNPKQWSQAINKAEIVWNNARRYKIKLKCLNLGGGLPTPYSNETSPIDSHIQIIRTALKDKFVGLKSIIIEPGRYMTHNASVMVASVIGKASRNRGNWIFLDVGGFNGLFEIFEDFKYSIQTTTTGPLQKYSVGGPTCDGMDVIRKDINLPPIKIGDRVYIMNAGAYSTSIKQYNGIKWAKNYSIKPS